jgi:hypothetical protein
VVGEFNGPTKLLVNYNQRRMRLEVAMTGCCDLVLDGFRDVDVYCPLMSIVPGMMLPIPLLSVVLKVIAPCFDKRRTGTPGTPFSGWPNGRW